MRHIEAFRKQHPVRRRKIPTGIVAADDADYQRQYQKRYRKTPTGRAMVMRTALKATHGITLERYEELFEGQRGLCAICRKAIVRAYNPSEEGARRGPKVGGARIDHDHRCCAGRSSCGKCIRGLLCSTCNGGLRGFNDDPGLLRAALEYLAWPFPTFPTSARLHPLRPNR